MTKVCASCDEPKEPYLFAAEGVLCHDCLLRASTRVETIWINGRRFHVCLKGARKSLAPTVRVEATPKGEMR